MDNFILNLVFKLWKKAGNIEGFKIMFIVFLCNVYFYFIKSMQLNNIEILAIWNYLKLCLMVWDIFKLL